MGQIGRCAFSLTPCYSPGSPPTLPTYTIHLHTSTEILFMQTDSSDTFFIPLFCPSVCRSSFCDELDVVGGIFFFKKGEEGKEKKSQLWIIARFFAHLIIKKPPTTTSVAYSSFSQPFHTALEKRRAGKTSHFHPLGSFYQLLCCRLHEPYC